MIVKLAIQIKREHILEDQKRFKIMAKHLKELMKDDKEVLASK